ncbi:MAG: hypothetical protein GXO25_04970 [Euryarchaeota archaeon]|nr:hypothetical protein [Euryarchaeota archaeon]
MREKIVFMVVVAVLTLLLMQGIAPTGDDDITRDERDTLNLDAKKIYTTTNDVYRISVYGDTVAWSEMFKRNDTVSDLDIVVSSGGGIQKYGKVGISEKYPAVGNMIVWEELPQSSGDSKIVGTSGVIYSQTGISAESPAIDGNNVVYVLSGSTENGVGYYISGTTGTISVGDTVEFVDISGNCISYNQYVYSLRNKTSWKVINAGTIYRISGDRVLFAGRSNFGKSVYMGVKDIKTGETDIFVNYDTGLYGGIDSQDFDGSFAVWAYEGSMYVYNVLSKKIDQIPVTGVTNVAIGGGSIAWVVHTTTGYEIWMAKTPAAGSFADVTLTDLTSDSSPDVEYHLLLVMDSQGRKFGGINPETHIMYDEIPGATVVRTGKIVEYRIPTTDRNSLKYQVIGRHDGKYSLNVKMNIPTRGYSVSEVSATDIPIKLNETFTYLVNWDKVAENANDAVKIEIDTNGDGTVDRTVTTSKDITASSIADSGAGGLESLIMKNMFFIILGIAVLVVLVVVLSIKKKK